MAFSILRVLALLIAATAVTSGTVRAAEPEKVSFASANTAATPLVGHLFRPAGSGPFPAVVAVHGCGGLFDGRGRFRSRDLDWANRFVEAGIAVLFPDSFNPRGVNQVCTLKQADRPVYPFGRSFDVAGAADWLASQSFVDKSRIGLVGWSHGGSTVLWTVRAGFAPKLTEFKTAIAFYPGCRVPMERPGWQPRLTLKILMGDRDDWTPPQPCRDLAAKHNVPLIEYPGAFHGFDAPGTPERVLKGLAFTANGTGEAHIGTHPAARAAAITEVMSTLQAAFAK